MLNHLLYFSYLQGLSNQDILSLDFNHAYLVPVAGEIIDIINNTHFLPGIPWVPHMQVKGPSLSPEGLRVRLFK